TTQGNVASEVLELRQALAAARTELDAVRDELTQARSGLTDAATLQERLTAAEAERDRLTAEIAELRNAPAATTDSSDAIAEAEARLASSLRAFALQEAELNRVRQEFTRSEGRPEAAAAELETTRAALATAQTGAPQEHDAQSEAERLRQELLATSEQLAQRERELM